MAEKTIKNKTIKGIIWNLIERFGVQFIRLLLGIVLARLLSPEEFGLIGIITVFFMIAEVFIDSGFGQAYVQKKEVTDKDTNTIFFTNLITSIVLYILLFFVSPFIAEFYEKPILNDLMRVMGLVIIINAFSLIQIAQLTRAMNFKRKSIITLPSVLIAGSVGVFAAWKGMGVWSLVMMNLAERSLTTLGLWLTTKWKPSLEFSRSSFREMFHFGAWILLSSLLAKLTENLYILVIGKIYPMAQLGYYSQAKKMERLSSRQITATISFVMLPVFSKAQGNVKRIQNMAKKFLQQSLIFIIPLLTLLIVNAEPFIVLLMTEKWAPMIPFLQLLSLLGMIYPMIKINNKLLLSFGKSKLAFNLSLLRSVFHLINIVLIYKYDVIYLIIGELVIAVIYYIIYTQFTKKYIAYGLIRQISDIWKVFVPALISGVIGYLLRIQVDNLWFSFLVGVVTTGGLYLLFQIIFNRTMFHETIGLIKTLIPAKKAKV